jgi:hypothetical protein
VALFAAIVLLVFSGAVANVSAAWLLAKSLE